MIPLFPLAHKRASTRAHTHAHTRESSLETPTKQALGRHLHEEGVDSHISLSLKSPNKGKGKKTKMVPPPLLLAVKEGDGMTRNMTNLLSAQAGVMFN